MNDVNNKDPSDHIVFTSIAGNSDSGQVLYNVFNGRFFGTTPEGVQFASEDDRDGTPWFDALLNFFYRSAA
jgi:hypothetical protein